MKRSAALRYQPFKEALVGIAQVTGLAQYKEDQIEKTLNLVVHVKGHTNVLVKDLFCPMWKAVVLIKRHDGSYFNPCGFASSRRPTRRLASKRL